MDRSLHRCDPCYECFCIDLGALCCVLGGAFLHLGRTIPQPEEGSLVLLEAGTISVVVFGHALWSGFIDGELHGSNHVKYNTQWPLHSE